MEKSRRRLEKRNSSVTMPPCGSHSKATLLRTRMATSSQGWQYTWAIPPVPRARLMEHRPHERSQSLEHTYPHANDEPGPSVAPDVAVNQSFYFYSYPGLAPGAKSHRPVDCQPAGARLGVRDFIRQYRDAEQPGKGLAEHATCAICTSAGPCQQHAVSCRATGFRCGPGITCRDIPGTGSHAGKRLR